MTTDHPSGSAGAVWHAAPASRLVADDLGDLIAVFDSGTGKTHLLAPLASILVTLLQEEASTGQGLLTRLSKGYDLASDEDPLAVIAARLQELDDLGLIHRQAETTV